MPGKKYPQPVDTYIGVITPEGVIESSWKKVSLTGIEVKEYGFSKAVQILCPDEWKAPLGDEWEDILSIIIAKCSPETYLRKEKEIRQEGEFHCQFDDQAGMLNWWICKMHGITLEDLEPLKSIYLIYLEKEKAVSRISDAQQKLLDQMGIGDALCC
ncbi:MAG: hypothetical protein LUF27_11910 [Lachnospiraceae bacterium]|nr:hypothetical protein [Lachnospiraceae bacterium]